MSRSTRDLTRRSIVNAINNLDVAQTHLAGAAQPYEDPHPKIYEHFVGLIKMIEQAKEPIKKLHDSI